MTILNLWPKDSFNEIGDWCKLREQELLGVTQIAADDHFMIRVDGRAFHTFTRGMERPFSTPFRNAMKAAASAVLSQLKPQFVYFQSDEITYVWTAKSTPGYTHPFKGKVSKLLSIVASLTSVAFYKACVDEGIDVADKLPHFDARLVEVLPNGTTLQSIMQPSQWRENDAMRNAIAMVAQSMFSHSELHGKNTTAQVAMATEAGFAWNQVPRGYLRGTYLAKSVEERTLTEEEILRIPVDNRPAPGEKFVRSVIAEYTFDNWDLVRRCEALLNKDITAE